MSRFASESDSDIPAAASAVLPLHIVDCPTIVGGCPHVETAMRAILLTARESVDHFEERSLPLPVPLSDEVRIRIRAAGSSERSCACSV